MGRKKQKQGRIETKRASSCEEVQFVLVKLAAIWPASELVLEVIFIAAFIAWQARTAPMRECLPICQCTTIQLMEKNKHEKCPGLYSTLGILKSTELLRLGKRLVGIYRCGHLPLSFPFCLFFSFLCLLLYPPSIPGGLFELLKVHGEMCPLKWKQTLLISAMSFPTMMDNSIKLQDLCSGLKSLSSGKKSLFRFRQQTRQMFQYTVVLHHMHPITWPL